MNETKNYPSASGYSNSQWLDSSTSTYGGSKEFPAIDINIPPRFDYYQVTFSKSTSLKHLYKLFINIFDGVEPSSVTYRQKQYDKCDSFSNEIGSVSFFSGGHNGTTYGINMCAKGRLADELARVLLEQDMEYSLARADVCQDFYARYVAIRTIIARQCKSARMKATEWGEACESPELKCRTFYGGGKNSPYQVVCYEKGLQLGDAYPEDYLRLEHRFRPKSFEKRSFAKLSALEMLGTHKVARKLSLDILDEEIEPFMLMVPFREKDPVKHMLIQFGPTLFQFLDGYGPCEGGQRLWQELEPKHGAERRRRLH